MLRSKEGSLRLGRMPKLVRRAKVSVTVIIVLCARFLLHVHTV